MDEVESDNVLPKIGWKEWVSLPEFNIKKIRAKIDTGAKTSAMHAMNISYEGKGDNLEVIFEMFTIPKNKKQKTTIKTQLLEKRKIKSSNGKSEVRPVISTNVKLGEIMFPIEITLTKRSNMKHRLLLGREALSNRFLVDTGMMYLHKLRTEDLIK